MENSLAPAFVRINYTSRWAPHSMTIPTVPLNNLGVVNTPPNFDLRGAAVDVNADTAIKDFIALIKPYFRTDTTFTDYVLYTQAGAGDVPVPVYSAALGITGTSVSTAVDKAVQQTWTWRADDATISKLVLLDTPHGGQFDKQTSLAGDAAGQAVSDYWTALVTWVASRGGGRPSTFLQVAVTLNEKLRRSYRMN